LNQVAKVEVMAGKQLLQEVVEVESYLTVFGMNQMLRWMLEVCVVLLQCMAILEDLPQVEVVHHVHSQVLAEEEGKMEEVEC
jgi:hypothetical protein